MGRNADELEIEKLDISSLFQTENGLNLWLSMN